MKRHLFNAVSALSGIAAVLACLYWAESLWYSTSCVWTSGTTRYQITSDCGHIYLIRNFDWWRKQPLVRVVDRNNGRCVPVLEWPGFDEETHVSFLGIEYASGKYLSAFSGVTENTEFLIPEYRDRFKPGTNLRTTTRFRLWGVPYWVTVVLTAILPGLWCRAELRRERAKKALEQTATNPASGQGAPDSPA